MLIPNIENRITLGIVAFVTTMVLLGWAAINEGGRMVALEDTFHARAIEQGASLFAANCTRCHGEDGRGRENFGPALNSPYFFGHDFFPEITDQITRLTTEQVALTAERSRPSVAADRATEIDARLAEIETRINELNAERNPQLQAAIDKGYNPQSPIRLNSVGWGGTLHAYVYTTLEHGRPASISYWPNGPMVAWSQTAGGPLRSDQLVDIADYILNWDKGDNWTLEDLFAVRQFPKVPLDPDLATIGPAVETAGSDVNAALTAIAALTGDAARGDQLYHGQVQSGTGNALPCAACHQAEVNGVGPMTAGTWTRSESLHDGDPALAGYTPEFYLVEAILLPGNYVVPDFSNAMQAGLGDLMTPQDLADIVAYLQTQTQ
ncbi:MAG TPA: c-type cytochrome [Aggregatilineales bacterium]|nr:c-type cytochrome [Aggregatilineales bacterium]